MKTDSKCQKIKRQKFDNDSKTVPHKSKISNISFDMICQRFPLVNRMVLTKLENQSLTRCIEASRGISEIIENEKFYWLRIIKNHKTHFKGFEEFWKEVTNKIPINTIRQLALAVRQFFKLHTFLRVTPLHIAAFEGNFQLCQYIFTRMGNKELHGNSKLELIPSKNYTLSKYRGKYDKYYKFTPLHFAAMQGNVETCRFIIQNVEVVNHKCFRGDTPLHMAAGHGNLEACRILINRMIEKNPKNNYGYTPLHKAAVNGNLDICTLIIGKVEEKNPEDKTGWTPLHIAANYGHFDVCRIIIEKIENKNPANNDGWTPLHSAASRGYLEICRLIIENVDNKHPVNMHGRTPKDLADRRNHVDVSQLFH